MARFGGTDITLKVPLGIGTLQWGTTSLDERLISGGRITDDTAEAIFAEFVANGVRFFDTAEGYGGGTSEERIGYIRERLEKDGRIKNKDPVIIATKFLPCFWRATHASFERALRGSLAKLKQDCCDVYFLHSPVSLWRSIEFWVESAALCKKKGLLKSLGLSNCSADEVRRAVIAGRKFGVPISCNQIMFNLLDYNSETLQQTVKTCHDLDVTVIAYSPIGQGLLTDNLTPEKFQSNRAARMTRLSMDQLTELRNVVKEIAETRNKTMAQVALNWCICHETVPLVGCRSVKQAKDTLGCVGWKLTDEEVKQLDEVALARSTLDSNRFKRGFFVVMASVLILSYRAAITYNAFFGTGTSRL